MQAVLSWIKDFVDITLPLDELASRLTLAGLEVEHIQVVGLPIPATPPGGHREFKIEGLAWEPDKIVVAAVHAVLPHPNADRLVLCQLEDGEREHIVLTGAPNLYPYKGQKLEQPLKVAYAREGARLYDGHQPGQVLTTLKRAKIRGVESYSMICSEKELGISEEHEGVILLDPAAPVGMPLMDYMGDAVLTIAITPNIARTASMLGVAREIAALTGQPLRQPDYNFVAHGAPIHGRAALEIHQPELNPRFVLGLVENVTIQPSPYDIQRRLRLAGMRPINNIVDATNYAMLELGEPLHAFDYDVLVQRAGGQPPLISTRTAEPGETLTTLDGVTHKLDDFSVLVCDTAGALSIAGVMGGAESEVNENTRTVLLEGAAWNYINVRRTVAAQKMTSEAAYRFSRGVHPALAERGVRRGLEMMRRWSGGVVAQGLVDAYPLPAQVVQVTVTPEHVRRWLGIALSAAEIAGLLNRLEFSTQVHGEQVLASVPDHRLDIGAGLIGVADVMEEIARVYGYDRIPETRLADALPPQAGNLALEQEERLRDILVSLGMQEVATYRLTSPEREARRLPQDSAPDDRPYVTLANPIASDRVVLRHSLLASLLEIAERNARTQPRLALFELAPVFLGGEEQLPEEQPRLVVLLSGQRALPGWQPADIAPMDFFDLKGVVAGILDGLHIRTARYLPAQHPTFHPGKCAQVWLDEQMVGVLGELHPLVKARYDFPGTAVLAADLDVRALLAAAPERYNVTSVAAFPPVLEDLALVVDEELPASQVAELIRQTGGALLSDVRLFDVYRGEKLGAGKKSLAYSLTYQSAERTLTDSDVAKLRAKIVRRLEEVLGARLRS